jgi:hypothetical protein
MRTIEQNIEFEIKLQLLRNAILAMDALAATEGNSYYESISRGLTMEYLLVFEDYNAK